MPASRLPTEFGLRTSRRQDHIAAAMQDLVGAGVWVPETVDVAALNAVLPRGQVSVATFFGGMNFLNPDTGSVPVLDCAAIEAFPAPDIARLATVSL